MKDVPTALPQGMFQLFSECKTLDILVHKGNLIFLMNQELLLPEVCVVKQWLNKYPKHSEVDLRKCKSAHETHD
jgi:hypothetical protein